MLSEVVRIWVESGDPRTGMWLLTASPVPVVVIVCVYLFVTRVSWKKCEEKLDFFSYFNLF
jgi:hypothetical protein